MILHFDLDLERLVSGPTGRSGAISRLSAMERAKVPLSLYFWRGRTPAAVTGTPVITLGFKSSLADANFLAVAEDADWTSTAGGTIWTATLDLATAEMIAAIGDMETLRALAQLSIALDDGSIPKSQPVETTIFGAVVQGDEGTPTAFPSPEDWLSARADPKFSVFVVASGYLNSSEEDSGTLSRLNSNNLILLAAPQNAAADGAAGDFQFDVEGPGTVFLESDATYDGPLPLTENDEITLLNGEFIRCAWDASALKWSISPGPRISGKIPIWNNDQGELQYISATGTATNEILNISSTL